MIDLDENDLLIVVGSSEQVVNFVYTARYQCNYNGHIAFVNKDKKLCESVSKEYGAVSFNMSATEFFKRYPVKKLMDEFNS